MRLTCPNCSARYEVADTMVPAEGRDVQCSNCSTTWFQPGRRSDATPTVTAEPVDTADGPARVAEETDTQPPQSPPPPSSEPAPPEAEDQPRRRTLDPALRSILEEEAAREARLRRAEADPVETQGEMPLGQESEDTHRARRRAELEAAPDAFDSVTGTEPETVPSARDLFPDIDEINSTLRDTGDRSGDEADASDIDTLDTIPRRRRGTRVGFFLVLALAAGAAALYANADRVATTAPGLAPALSGYVTAVNGARFWLDDLAQGLAGDTPEG